MTIGDLIRVSWVDITAFPTGAPKDAKPAAFKTIGFFAGWVNDKELGRYLCVSDTTCSNNPDEQFFGVTVFPKGCIRELEEFGDGETPEEPKET